MKNGYMGYNQIQDAKCSLNIRIPLLPEVCFCCFQSIVIFFHLFHAGTVILNIVFIVYYVSFILGFLLCFIAIFRCLHTVFSFISLLCCCSQLQDKSEWSQAD